MICLHCGLDVHHVLSCLHIVKVHQAQWVVEIDSTPYLYQDLVYQMIMT